MRRPSFLVLSAVAAAGPVHGYGIVDTVKRITHAQEQLSLGGVYGVLDRLQSDGLIQIDSEKIESGRLRRLYVVTGQGRAALASEVKKLESDARLGRRALGSLSEAPS